MENEKTVIVMMEKQNAAKIVMEKQEKGDNLLNWLGEGRGKAW